MIRHGTASSNASCNQDTNNNSASETGGNTNNEKQKTPILRSRSATGDESVVASSSASLFKLRRPRSFSQQQQLDNASASNSTSNTSWINAMRWVMLGIVIGSSATSIVHSMSMPTSMSMPAFCVGPPHHQESDAPPISATTTTTGSGSKRLADAKAKVDASREAQAKANTGNNNTESSNQKTKEPELQPVVFLNPLPPPPVLAKNETFASCLLIKDDNHWLIEWLAYHYHVLPLRKLIVVIDPDSKTSPKKILGRWNNGNKHNNNKKLMDIKIWKDKDFMPKKITATKETFDNNTALMMHRVRQNNFYRKCIPYLRNQGHEWLALMDTDEYILPSYASGFFRNLTSKVSFQEPGSVLRLLKYYEQATVPRINNTCVYMPRFFFGAKESRTHLVNHNIPASAAGKIDAMGMVTQRFLYREPRRNANGKNLLHLQRVQSLKTFGGVHHVSTVVCPDPETMRSLDLNKHSLIRVHHYLGTLEQYMFRDDPRMAVNHTHSNSTNGTTIPPKKIGSYNPRGLQRYNEYNEKAFHEDHAAKAWIRGFFKTMGVDLASELLKGVGQVGIEE